jgi:ribonuclease Z
MKVARDRLESMGLATGPWLRSLRQAVLAGAPDDTPLRVRWHDRTGEHDVTRRVGELRPAVLDVVAGQRFGYVTDLRHTDANVRALEGLLAGVDILFIESVFLEEDGDHAERKNHLTARQAGGIARRLGARAVVPFHFSPRYEGRSAALVAEVQSAWSGTASQGGSP